MRLAHYPLINDIKEEYMRLRREGYDRQAAVEMLRETYNNELTIGAEDDGLLFWIGLADAQYDAGELTKEVSQQAIAALEKVEAWGLSPVDLQRRAQRYQQAPMAEKCFQKPRHLFSCPWEIGDTFAYKLRGPHAEQCGIAGKYALLRKVGDTIESPKSPDPIVTITIWDDSLPKSAEEFIKKPILKLESGGRFGSPKTHFEYRTKLVVNSKSQLNGLHLVYLGRFLDVPMPEDEIIFTKWVELNWCVAKTIDSDIALFYTNQCAQSRPS